MEMIWVVQVMLNAAPRLLRRRRQREGLERSKWRLDLQRHKPRSAGSHQWLAEALEGASWSLQQEAAGWVSASRQRRETPCRPWPPGLHCCKSVGQRFMVTAASDHALPACPCQW